MHAVKKRLYFVVAGYFAFWARFVLRRWQPRIVVITGSSGKTSTLHLVEAQLGERALYSHHANGALGIPFHILGLPTNVPSKPAWLGFLLKAPFCAFRRPPESKLYIVEADCDRPYEGAFLGRLLKPEVTVWVSVFRTHSMNFDKLVKSGAFPTHEAAIAYEFGNFAAAARKLVIASGDQPALVEQLQRVQPGVRVVTCSLAAVDTYEVMPAATRFSIGRQAITLKGLHPKELGVNLQLVDELLKYLDNKLDPDYAGLHMPPGRSSIFAGQRDTTLIDSTYNTGLGAMTALLNLFKAYPAPTEKWLVLGDILEQGSVEREEHEKLAEAIAEVKADHIILLGPRTKQYTYPRLQALLPVTPIVSFESPREVLDYLNMHLKGHETILFKGARGLEGVIEQLLADPAQASELVRREPVWIKRRQQWGLPR
jgi:UDP-N-acetylmuramoyl-tripeptide--D-alanyl-D-alanine ligase